ncbi:MAG: hypothetical protein RLY93_06025 [Sumerlaeia bacterium]
MFSARKLTLTSISLCLVGTVAAQIQEPPSRTDLGDYVVIGWNDLGMHCMNGEYSEWVILPPYNNLWAQIVKRGNPPQLVSSDMVLEYRFPENTTSANKVNFWEHEDKLFGVDLPEDIGLTGHGLAGTLEWNGSAWEVTGVPITPFTDANPTVEQPYQLAEVTLRQATGGPVLDQAHVVVPTSTEIHCNTCHSGEDDDKSRAKDVSIWPQTSKPGAGYKSLRDLITFREVTKGEIEAVERVLEAHDEVDGRSLLDQQPVLCAECHSSNALGTTGRPGVKSLSQAIHEKHGEEFPTMNCYACHPGQQTQCLRGAMYKAGQSCEDCHGSIRQVARSIEEGRRPWIDEPKCGSCHAGYDENPGKLYRNSIGHGGLYCTACHGSPHAEYPTVQPRDNYQALRLQGTAKTLSDCRICHTKRPTGPGPHGLPPPTTQQWVFY